MANESLTFAKGYNGFVYLNRIKHVYSSAWKFIAAVCRGIMESKFFYFLYVWEKFQSKRDDRPSKRKYFNECTAHCTWFT